MEFNKAWAAICLLTCAVPLAAQSTISGKMSLQGNLSVYRPIVPAATEYVSGTVGLSTTGSVAVNYTCTSTSHRLLISSDAVSGQTITLSDTGGQASGATQGVHGNLPSSGDSYSTWNMGCLTSSNAITAAIGSSAFVNIMVLEYTNLGTGFDGSGGAANGGSTSCTASLTASDSHDLVLFYGGFNSSPGYVLYPTAAGYNTRLINGESDGNSYGGIVIDNLNAASGSLSYTTSTFASSSNNRCWMVAISRRSADIDLLPSTCADRYQLRR